MNDYPVGRAITGEDEHSTVRDAHTHSFGGHTGLLVYTRPHERFIPEVHPFLNPSFGQAMNQNVTFGGTPEIIHNGGTSVEWTGTAIQGTWNFADTGKVSLTTAENNDSATFSEETPTTIDLSGFTALTGKVDLDIYNPVNNTLTIAFDLSGVPVGNSVNLDAYIDTGNFTEQSFAIPKADMGLMGQLVDGFTITLTRTGGSKPTMKFDDIQLEQTGESAVFMATTPKGTRFHVTAIRTTLVDAIDTTLASATMPNLSYNKLLGVSELTNGISFQRIQNKETLFTLTLRHLGDFLSAGSAIVDVIADATNACLTLEVTFPEPLVLNGDTDDFLSYTINDDLSGLIVFQANTRGAVEII